MSEAHDTTGDIVGMTPDSTGVEPVGEPTDWRAGLPEDIAGHDLVKNSADVAALAKQAIDMQAYQGQSIRIPSEHASDEDRAAFRDKLRQHAPQLIEADLTSPETQRDLLRRMGLPEEPAGYQRPELEVPDELQSAVDMSMVDAFQPIAHEVGLTQAQFETIVDRMGKDTVQQVAERTQQHQQEMNALRKEWGFAYEAKESAASAVAKMAREHGVPLPEDLSQVGAPTLRWLADLGEKLGGEGSSLQQDQGEARGVMTPAEAQARLDEMYGNSKHPIWDASHPDHDRAIQEKSRLHQLAAGPEGGKPHAGVLVGDETVAY